MLSDRKADYAIICRSGDSAYAIFYKSVRVVKIFPTHCFRGAVLALLLIPAGNAMAQQLQPAPWNDPAIVWLAPAQAQTEVQNKLNLLEPQLADLTAGTGQHTDMLRQIVFYKSMLRSFAGGQTVLKAIEFAVIEAASLGGVYEHTFTPEATLRTLYDEALALLSN